MKKSLPCCLLGLVPVGILCVWTPELSAGTITTERLVATFRGGLPQQAVRGQEPNRLIARCLTHAMASLPVGSNPNVEKVSITQGEIFYQLPDPPGKGPHKDYFRVALTARGVMWGWVPKGDFLVWKSREAIRFRGPARQERALLFKRLADVSAWMERKTKQPNLPWLSERSVLEAGSFLPVLESESVNLSSRHGKLDALCVAFESSKMSVERPDPSDKKVRKPTAAQLSMTLDIAFVVDSTASMSNALPMVKRSIQRCCESVLQDPKLGSLNKRIRFALVGFRDHLAQQPFETEVAFQARVRSSGSVVKTYCSLSGAEQFLTLLDGLKRLDAMAASSDEASEAALEALETTLDKELGWGSVAARHIVLITDAAGHDTQRSDRPAEQTRRLGYNAIKNPHSLSPARILRIAQPPVGSLGGNHLAEWHVVIHALHVDHGSAALSSRWQDERSVARRQLRELSSGEWFEGIFYGGRQMAAGLRYVREAVVRHTGLVWSAVGKTPDKSDLRRIEDRTSDSQIHITRLDGFRGDQPVGVGLHAAWIPDTEEGLFERFVFVRKHELETGVKQLALLRSALEDGRRLEDAVRLAASAGGAVRKGSPRQSARVVDYLNQVPSIARSVPCLQRRLAAIARMPKAGVEIVKWRASLGTMIEDMESLIVGTKWLRLHPGRTGATAKERWAFLKPTVLR